MKLKKCPLHGYTLEANCPICRQETKDAHYKFIKIRSANGESETAKESEQEKS